MTVGQDEAVAPSPNADLFVAVLAQIEKHPETWEQGAWRTACGTAFCFAGWACEITGVQWVAPLTDEQMYRYVRTDDSGDNRPVYVVASDLLGLPPVIKGGVEGYIESREAQQLFHPLNTLGDLYRVSADLLGVDEQVLRDKVAAVVADGTTQAVSA